MLIPNTLLDIKYKKVWMPIILPFILEGIILMVINLTDVIDGLMGILLGAVFLLISCISKGAIGRGDGYIICATGCLLGGYRTILIVTGAMFISSIAGIVMMVFFHWGKKRTMPFVPFLFATTLVSMFCY